LKKEVPLKTRRKEKVENLQLLIMAAKVNSLNLRCSYKVERHVATFWRLR